MIAIVAPSAAIKDDLVQISLWCFPVAPGVLGLVGLRLGARLLGLAGLRLRGRLVGGGGERQGKAHAERDAEAGADGHWSSFRPASGRQCLEAEVDRGHPQ